MPDELFHGIPVIDERIGCHGQPVKVLCRGDLNAVILRMGLLRKSLPQNSATLQGAQHTILRTCEEVRF